MADTSTVGGVMSGYCAIGSPRSEMMPAKKTMIDSTEAKIGRLMKKLENTTHTSTEQSCRKNNYAPTKRKGRKRSFRAVPPPPVFRRGSFFGLVQTRVARPEVLRRAWVASAARCTPFGVLQGV